MTQLDAESNSRTYAYLGHLLARYTDHTGFGYKLEWYHDLAPFPVRYVRTVADDGSEDM